MFTTHLLTDSESSRQDRLINATHTNVIKFPFYWDSVIIIYIQFLLLFSAPAKLVTISQQKQSSQQIVSYCYQKAGFGIMLRFIRLYYIQFLLLFSSPENLCRFHSNCCRPIKFSSKKVGFGIIMLRFLLAMSTDRDDSMLVVVVELDAICIQIPFFSY